MRKMVRSSSGRVVRPSTEEIRYEVKLLTDGASSDVFDHGVLVALEWVLGERKTLRRPEK